MDESEAQVRASGNFGNRPLIVLTSANRSHLLARRMRKQRNSSMKSGFTSCSRSWPRSRLAAGR